MLARTPNEHGLGEFGDHVFHLPRGFRWRWYGRTWMALGGATSVDRAWRKPGVDWWREEEITQRQANEAVAGGPVDVMLCHDVPFGVSKLEAFIAPNTQGWPESALSDAYRHRLLLRSVVDDVRPTALRHGRYHYAYDDVMTLAGGYRVQIHELDMDDTTVEANTRMLDALALTGDAG